MRRDASITSNDRISPGLPELQFRPTPPSPMKLQRCLRSLSLLALLSLSAAHAEDQGAMSRLPYNNPGLVVDLGVGLWAWPLPMDYNGDGRMDLVVVCTDKPYNGTWFFENSGQTDTGTR